MATKTERIEMRTDPDTGARITQAAQITQTSVSAFVLDAATAAAERVLARRDQTIMPAEQFDALIASLDTPDTAPKLTQIAARPRRFTRR
jgi:uncharacterized protein (DUF1778 family)